MFDTNEQKQQRSVFDTLYSVNVQGHVEVKDTGRAKLNYLSWAWAWAEVKKAFPEAFYTIYENADGLFYHTDGKTAWVKTGVTINGLEHIEYLPVMDNRNSSITIDKLTSVDVNKAIQRSLTKACARHGLGLYIYAGEDLPEDEKAERAASTLQQAIDEVRAVTSRQEFETCYKRWQAALAPDAMAKFRTAAADVAKRFPKPAKQ